MVSLAFLILIAIKFIHHVTIAHLFGPTVPVLVLDVDGTLYDNDCNIESQIVYYIEEFVAGLGIDKVKCTFVHLSI